MVGKYFSKAVPDYSPDKHSFDWRKSQGNDWQRNQNGNNRDLCKGRFSPLKLQLNFADKKSNGGIHERESFLFSRGMKRITTPKLLGLLVGSLLLFAGLIAFDNAGKVPTHVTAPARRPAQIPYWAIDTGDATLEDAQKIDLPDWAKDSQTPHITKPPISTPPAATSLAIPVIGVVLLLTILAASAMLAWRLMKPVGAQKFTLFCGAVVFVLCGFFPPWLYTYDVTATHSHSDAGYSFILSPPLKYGRITTADGIQLDTSRLLIEWVCILVATGAGWLLTTGMSKGKKQLLQTTDDSSGQHKENSLPDEPLAVGIQSAPTPATMPDTIEKQLRERVLDFVSTEFRDASKQFQERAAKFIGTRLQWAAKQYFSENQMLYGFGDSELLRTTAAKFRDLTGRNEPSRASNAKVAE